MSKKMSTIMEFGNYLGIYKFITVTSVVMWEMFLVGFVKTEHVPFIKNEEISYVAAGIGGVLGNKGGLQMSFKLYDYLFNFINVHLVHGAKRYEKRNEMMGDVIRKMRVQREEMDPDVAADFAFILGDMNYRMEGTFEELVPHIDKLVGMRKKLDQLHKSMTEQGKYPDYKEFDINFLPTYKKSKVDDNYFNKKNQAPSYTDRVLLRCNVPTPAAEVNLVSYTSLSKVYGSDHRPVQLDLDFTLKPRSFLHIPRLMSPQMSNQ
jgi:hypothetical protein